VRAGQACLHFCRLEAVDPQPFRQGSYELKPDAHAAPSGSPEPAAPISKCDHSPVGLAQHLDLDSPRLLVGVRDGVGGELRHHECRHRQVDARTLPLQDVNDLMPNLWHLGRSRLQLQPPLLLTQRLHAANISQPKEATNGSGERSAPAGPKSSSRLSVPGRDGAGFGQTAIAVSTTRGSTLIEVTFDEGVSTNQTVAAVFINPALSHVVVSQAATHYSTLKLNEDLCWACRSWAVPQRLQTSGPRWVCEPPAPTFDVVDSSGPASDVTARCPAGRGTWDDRKETECTQSW
jgi:hypothetical protein